MRDISASVPAISTPTVPAPTSTNVNRPTNFLTLRRLGSRNRRFRSLERQQDFSSNHIGVAQRFEARCEFTPFVMPKIVVLNTSCQDEEVVS